MLGGVNLLKLCFSSGRNTCPKLVGNKPDDKYPKILRQKYFCLFLQVMSLNTLFLMAIFYILFL